MAASSLPQGYQCQFLDSVPEDLYCKQCSLVARKLTITSCCITKYCNACIFSIQQANKSCPGCGEEKFEIFTHAKSQEKILSFQVCCLFKERGCCWSGRLEELDAHLDPDQGDCEYADVHCPLKCGQLIDRKKVADHKTNECVKRDYICPHCSFKATYEIVSSVHWPECSYYPLPCPNHCGVTCERQTMEYHMKICPLEEVECEFQDVGCVGKFRREEEEEHMREKSQAHLTMMATALVRLQIKQQEQEKMFAQEKKEYQLTQKRDFERLLLTQKKELEGKLKESEMNFEKELQAQRKYFEEKLQVQQKTIEEFKSGAVVNRQEIKIPAPYIPKVPQKFTLVNYTYERKQYYDRRNWKSGYMYTHEHGYKFRVGINPNGVNVILLALKGEYDDQLKWPARVRFIIELINHLPNGDNKKVGPTLCWEKPTQDDVPMKDELLRNDYHQLVKYSTLRYESDDYETPKTQYLKGDALYFIVSDIIFL